MCVHLLKLIVLVGWSALTVGLVLPACNPVQAAEGGDEAGERREHSFERIPIPHLFARLRSTLPQGMKALTVNEQANVQPFTTHDVTDYFRAHNLPMNSGSPSQFKVEELEFLTNEEVSQRLGRAPLLRAANDQVGFVTLVGTFFFTGPPGTNTVIYSRAYAGFDAKTGNLLIFGALQPEVP